MYCAKCGKKLTADAKFCPECGGGVSGGEGGQPHRSFRKQIIFLLVLIFVLSTVVFYLLSYSALGKNTDTVSGLITMADMVVFVVLVVYVIKEAKERRKEEKNRRPNFKASLAMLGVLIIILISFLIYSHYKTVEPGILAGNSVYRGLEPDPVILDYPDENGQTISAWAYPGQLTIFIPEDKSVSDLRKVISPYGGKILSKIPKIGFYFVEVNKDDEAKTITELRKDSLVLSVWPNLTLVPQNTSLVDLSDKGTVKGGLTSAILNSPDPNAKIILAQLDSFRKYDPDGTFTDDTHGPTVNAEREKITGSQPVLQVHVGGLPCGSLNMIIAEEGEAPKNLCSSSAQSINGLAAIIAGAELNGQKVDINLSWGVVPATHDENKFDQANAYGQTTWAAAAWESYEEQIFSALNVSEWARKGNVILNQAAGNGVQLLNDKNEAEETTGIYISEALKGLQERYPAIQDSVNLYGALNASDNALADYSNFGRGVIYAKLTSNDLSGTSFAAPLAWGTTFQAWNKFPDLSAGAINQGVRNAAAQNAGILDADEAMAAITDISKNPPFQQATEMPASNPSSTPALASNQTSTSKPTPTPTIQPQDLGQPTGTAAPKIEFTLSQTIFSGTVGQQFSYSFCQPALTTTSALCAGSATNPKYGLPPYSFYVESGTSLPFGLSLNLNGLLTGTPTAEGSRTVGICAKDTGGFSVCRKVTINVAPAPEVYERFETTECTLIENTVMYPRVQDGSCPERRCYESFTIHDGILKVDNFPYEGSIGSSGSLTFDTGEGNDMTRDSLVLHLSGDTITGTNTFGWGGTEGCTYSFTAEKKASPY